MIKFDYMGWSVRLSGMLSVCPPIDCWSQVSLLFLYVIPPTVFVHFRTIDVCISSSGEFNKCCSFAEDVWTTRHQLKGATKFYRACSQCPVYTYSLSTDIGVCFLGIRSQFSAFGSRKVEVKHNTRMHVYILEMLPGNWEITIKDSLEW